MNIAVFGTGGVGGYFGSRFAESGCDVHCVARGSHLEAMRRDGLFVRSPPGDLHLGCAISPHRLPTAEDLIAEVAAPPAEALVGGRVDDPR